MSLIGPVRAGICTDHTERKNTITKSKDISVSGIYFEIFCSA
jgi:hypothetical protein